MKRGKNEVKNISAKLPKEWKKKHSTVDATMNYIAVDDIDKVKLNQSECKQRIIFANFKIFFRNFNISWQTLLAWEYNNVFRDRISGHYVPIYKNERYINTCMKVCRICMW